MIEDSVAVQEPQSRGPEDPEGKERSRCAGCGEPSGKPSEGGKALGGLRNRRGKGQPMYCMDCHPERMGGSAARIALMDLGAA